KKVNRLRRAGILPATVYGKGVGPFTVQLNARGFSDAYRRAGRTTLVDVSIPGEKGQSVFIHSLQRHPVTRTILHVDFLAVDLKTEITVEVPIHITGESELVNRGDATLNQVLNTLDVRALPTELPPYIEVDISELDSFDKSIHVRDIPALEKGEIVTDADELIVSLTQSRPAEEEEAVEEETEAAAEPELVREKREDEEDAE
ncbi:MAG TPA: 50S ribosomal protein L25, partial [Roseiflexaceae bacterium]|nr:50S ribosomal protein L25 [Roseiflexaceae bacterium]